MKECRECGGLKPLDEFYAHPRMADGHLNKCKSCVKTRVADHRERNLETVRAYDRCRADLPHRVALRKQVAERWKSDPELRARSASQKAAWSHRNPQKRAANYAVNNALRDGKLARQPCECCGNPKAEAHHDDYSKPLDVKWLCHADHMKRHRELREEARGWA